jgi:hypothetical protein
MVFFEFSGIRCGTVYPRVRNAGAALDVLWARLEHLESEESTE